MHLTFSNLIFPAHFTNAQFSSQHFFFLMSSNHSWTFFAVWQRALTCQKKSIVIWKYSTLTRAQDAQLWVVKQGPYTVPVSNATLARAHPSAILLSNVDWFAATQPHTQQMFSPVCPDWHSPTVPRLWVPSFLRFPFFPFSLSIPHECLCMVPSLWGWAGSVSSLVLAEPQVGVLAFH